MDQTPTGHLRRLLTGIAEFARHPKGQKLFSVGDPARHIFIICIGQVRLTIPQPDEPEERLLDVLADLWCFGIGDATSGSTRSYNAITEKATLLASLPLSKFEEFCGTHPSVAMAWMESVLKRVKSDLPAHSIIDAFK